VDARIIAATNQDLEAAVASRTFREDLFYRLKRSGNPSSPLAGSPRRHPSLVGHFLAAFAQEQRTTPSGLARGHSVLLVYGWPGNVGSSKTS